MAVLSIGSWCEEALRLKAQDNAFRRYENTDRAADIRWRQDEIEQAGNRFVSQTSKEIDALGRYASIRLPVGGGARSTVLTAAAERFGVSQGTADRYWKRYRKLLERAKEELNGLT